MNKKSGTFIALIAAFIAISSPVILAIFLAQKQGVDSAKNRALFHAKDVIHRTESMLDQVYRGVDELVETGATNPCSDANIAVMQDIDVRSSYIQAIGHINRNRLMCSSFGRHGEGLFLGPGDVTTPRRSTLRYNVKIPFTKEGDFLVIENSKYGALIHKDLPVDTTVDTEGMSLGMFTRTGRKIVASSGHTKQE
jgi:sensor c-di-GMP phosphodiesterase-like protein